MRDTHELVSDTSLDQSPKISASLHVLLVSVDAGPSREKWVRNESWISGDFAVDACCSAGVRFPFFPVSFPLGPVWWVYNRDPAFPDECTNNPRWAGQTLSPGDVRSG